MSQVLKYGVPIRERLLCDSPGCTELATVLIKFATNEHLTCDQHKTAVLKQQAMQRYVVLDMPGERNLTPEPEKINGKEDQEAKED